MTTGYTDGKLVEGNDKQPEYELAASGSLSPSARAAASRHALPLISQYFMLSNADMHPVRLFSTADAPQHHIASMAGLRLRLALARATELLAILDDINKRPSFRYELAKETSVGMLAGQLDFSEYAFKGGQVEEAATFPVLTIRRGAVTPENILATHAANWALSELRSAKALAAIPATSPEAHQVMRLSVRLQRFLKLPMAQACFVASSRLQNTGQLKQLQSSVRTRVRRREVLAPDGYKHLVAWTENSILGVSNVSGKESWLHYGPEFDTRLFELWCVHLLAQSIAETAYLASPDVLTNWRKDGMVFRWQRPGGLIEIFYQRSIQAVTKGSIKPRWIRRRGGQRNLGGVPDIIVRTLDRTGRQRLAVVDPKLRQRSSVPTEELYKVLGYIENYEQSASALGAILFHDPDMKGEIHEFEAGTSQERLFALPLNPLDEAKSLENIRPLTDIILGEVGVESRSHSTEGITDIHDFELAVVEARMNELRCAQAAMGSLLEPSRDRVEMSLGASAWSRLDVESQNMLATAEHIGFTLEATADYSAGTIGVCAALEQLIFKELVEPVLDANPGIYKGHIMFGTAIVAIGHGLQGKGNPLARAIGMRIRELGMNEGELAALTAETVGPLWIVNKDYRVPAAHRTFMTRQQWRMGWQLIIGEGQVLRRLSAALETIKG